MTRGPVRTPAIESVFSRRSDLAALPDVLDRIVDAAGERREDARARSDETGRRQAGPEGRARSRSAPSTAIVTSWPSTSPFGSDGASGISAAATLGASVTRPVTTVQRSLTGAISDDSRDCCSRGPEQLRQIGRQLRDVARARGQERLELGDGGVVEPDRLRLAEQRIGIGDDAFEPVDHPEEKRTIAPSSGSG